MRYSLAVFDFDGTLVASEACIRQSLDLALEQHGLPSLPIRKEWIGQPLDLIIRSACASIDQAGVSSVIGAYRTHYAALDGGLTFPFDGILDALTLLAARGVTLAIGTNKHSTPARATLERLGIARLFPVIVGAESVAHPKPDPDILLRVLELTGARAADTLMIGDAGVDLQMAAGAGVASCAVTWGNHSREQLVTHQPTYVIDSPAALPPVILG